MELLTGPKIYERAVEAAAFIQKNLSAPITKGAIGVICGSGLGGLVEILWKESENEHVTVKTRNELNYGDIPHWPKSTVVGHAGKLVFGNFGEAKKSIVMMVGRAHFYEGHSIQDVVFPIRVMKLLGVETMIVTNAAGGLNTEYRVGDLVMLNDHINLAGLSGNHPLRGTNVDDFGVRFPPLSEAYDLELRRQSHSAWGSFPHPNRQLHEGVYAYVSGPSYETRAECRLLRTLGADLVGMSTVPEIIVARHCSIRVLAMSLVTNSAVFEPSVLGNDPKIQNLSPEELKSVSAAGKADHKEVLEEGQKAAQDMQQLITIVLERLTAN